MEQPIPKPTEAHAPAISIEREEASYGVPNANLDSEDRLDLEENLARPVHELRRTDRTLIVICIVGTLALIAIAWLWIF